MGVAEFLKTIADRPAKETQAGRQCQAVRFIRR
jgi:hypothetical protein